MESDEITVALTLLKPYYAQDVLNNPKLCAEVINKEFNAKCKEQDIIVYYNLVSLLQKESELIYEIVQ
jgi:hypothetical protein